MKKTIILIGIIGFSMQAYSQQREPLNNTPLPGSKVVTKPERTPVNNTPIPGQYPSKTPREEMEERRKQEPVNSNPLPGQVPSVPPSNRQEVYQRNVQVVNPAASKTTGVYVRDANAKPIPFPVEKPSRKLDANHSKENAAIIPPTQSVQQRTNSSQQRLHTKPALTKEQLEFQKTTQSGSGNRNETYVPKQIAKPIIPAKTNNGNMQGQNNIQPQAVTDEQIEFQKATQSGSGNRNEVQIVKKKPMVTPIVQSVSNQNGAIQAPASKSFKEEQIKFQRATQSGKPGRK